MKKMKSVCFHGSKLKLVKALLFRSFHETEASTAGFCLAFICGRAYLLSVYRVTQKKYSCLIKRKMNNKGGIFKIKIGLKYQ